jgi:hypothetical protein
MVHVTSGQIGINLAGGSEATPSQTLGTQLTATDMSQWVYISASEAIAQYDVVGITEAYAGAKITKALVDTAENIGFAPAALSSGEYGWVQLTGVGTINVLASCAADAVLYSCATAGSLDDDSTSQTKVHGIKLTSARGGTAGSAAAMASWPRSSVT